MKLYSCLLAFLWPVGYSIAQTQATTIRPLSIGDTVPDVEITNIINYPVSKIQLSSFKGKMIILDFWGKYCSSCIASFPRMDSLQTFYKEQVQIITISDFPNKDDLMVTLAKYKITKNLRLTATIHHEQLANMFPHELVSHVVWINKEGVVAAITGSDYVTSQNIQQALNNDVAHWPIKKDMLDFDYRKPLLGLGQKDLPTPTFLYYSTLTASISGVSAPNIIIRDSTKGIATVQHLNAPLLWLCKIALNHPPDGSISLDVKNISRYNWTKEELYSDWFRTNTYCYALVLPIYLTKEEIKQAVQTDLLRWLTVLGITITPTKKMEAGKEVTTYIISDKK